MQRIVSASAGETLESGRSRRLQVDAESDAGAEEVKDNFGNVHRIRACSALPGRCRRRHPVSRSDRSPRSSSGSQKTWFVVERT